MTDPARRWYTREEYLTDERFSDSKHEYYDGVVYAMAGGTPKHNAICARVIVALGTRLGRGRCVPVSSDQRLETPSGVLTYPDVSVYCGPIVLTDDRSDTATNPAVLVEVLSKKTRKYDLGEKREHYESVPSLRDYVCVDSEKCEVTHWYRVEGGWDQVVHRSTEATLVLRGIDLEIPVDEIYGGLLD